VASERTRALSAAYFVVVVAAVVVGVVAVVVVVVVAVVVVGVVVVVVAVLGGVFGLSVPSATALLNASTVCGPTTPSGVRPRSV
jgi:hypothetical protein